ncbi:MAG: hypothetical protein ACR2GY_05350 [Phycisphaerales bacterium]
MLASLVCAFAALLGSLQFDDAGRDERAVAVARLLLHHDMQIGSLETRHADYVQVQQADGGWRSRELLRAGLAGEDSLGNWYFRGVAGERADLDAEIVEVGAAYVSTASYSVGWIPGKDVFIIQEPLQNPRLYPGPFMALGRWLDTTGIRRLGELLLQSPTLQIQDVDPEEGTLLLRGDGILIDGAPSVLLVTVSREYGYAPIAIRRFDALYNSLAEEILTLSYTLVDDIWVPKAGTRTLYTRTTLSAAKKREYEQLRDHHSAKAGNSGDPNAEALRAAALQIFGPEGWPVAPLGPVMTSFEIEEVRGLNAELTPQLMTAVVSPEAVVFNTVNGLDTESTTLEAVIQGFPLVRVSDGAIDSDRAIKDREHR